jgi:NAD(P)-dependent dehydrogenase (short-subunit alcohol dehydrogenase family)
MDLELTGRRALVTGGSRGIGLAVGRALAGEGADVALVARGEEALRRAAEDVARESGRRAIAVAADTGDDASVAAMVAEVVAQLGGVDILVNAAATPATGAPFTDDDLEAEINVKVRGYLRCARAVAPAMVERGWGRIVNIGGLAARQTGNVVGSVRNVAVAAMSKTLADELGPRGIRVNGLLPGRIATDRVAELDAATGDPEAARAAAIETIPLRRYGRPEEFGRVASFVLSPAAAFVSGVMLPVDGGMLRSL